MNTMTLQIELPAGVTIDQQHLQELAAGYIQRYVYRMQKAPIVGTHGSCVRWVN